MGFVYANSAGDVTVANTLVETSLLGSLFTLPAGEAVVGMTFRVHLRGILTTVAPAPSLQLRAFLGGIAVADSGTVTLAALAGVNVAWELELDLTVKTTGAAATYQVMGRVIVGSSTALLPSAGIMGLFTTGTAVDLTANAALDIKATWGTANASDTITQKTAVIELTSV